MFRPTHLSLSPLCSYNARLFQARPAFLPPHLPNHSIHRSLIDTQLFVAFDPLFPDAFSFDVVVHFRMVATSPTRPVAPSLFFRNADSSFLNRLLNNLLRD